MKPNPTSAHAPTLRHLSDLLTQHVRAQPERIAVGTSDLKSILSYRQLDALVQSLMAKLCRLGLRRGDTVALLADNSLEFVLGLLAVVSFGARLAPLNPALAPAELQTRLSQLSAAAVLASGHLESKLVLVDAIPSGIRRWVLDVVGSGDSAVARIVDRNPVGSSALVTSRLNDAIDSRDVALLMFTGGTTGAPKLVPLTHGNLTASIANIASSYGLTCVDATLVVMPLFHVHGLIGGLLATLVSGGSAYLPSTGLFSAHLFWADVARLGVTWYTAVPTIHRILLNRASKEFQSARRALRFIRSCSAPLDEELAASVAATFGAPVISAYGMTEASHQLASNPLPVDGPNRPSSVGLPTNVEIRLIGEDDTDAPPGKVGEIWIKGATVTAGYWNNPEASSASFVDGWFRTGDLGSRDENGYLFVKGRLKDMIDRGGEKIWPSDVDAALLAHPKVLEAASFGQHDEVYGETVEAAVILRPEMALSEAELRDYCGTRLSAFEVPKRIYVVNDLPRTAKGSIDRHALAAHFANPRWAVVANVGRES